MANRIKILDEIRPDLDALGLPWSVQNGSKHFKLYVCGRLVTVMSRSPRIAELREIENTRARIRRVMRERGLAG
jgi:hypothetical protein